MTYFEELELIGEEAEEDAQWFLSTIRAYKDDHDRLLKTAKTFEGGLENDRLHMTRVIRIMGGREKTMNDKSMHLGEWSGSTEPTIIDGSKCIPTVFGTVNNIPSVWIEPVSETELKFCKELLEYFFVTAQMAEDSGNDELAWRIWQVYGRLESLWEANGGADE